MPPKCNFIALIFAVIIDPNIGEFKTHIAYSLRIPTFLVILGWIHFA